MRINKIILNDFRNYKSADIDCADEYNIIYGNNAQGKTNIIEAIFLCASGRSHRTSKDNELLRIGATGFLVELIIERESLHEKIEINYSPDEKKKIKINGIPLKKLGELMGHISAVIFSPEDLLVIKQGPSERRRFIDITLSQLRPSYFFELQQYARILHQRNMLLKDVNTRKDLDATLEIWDRHMAKSGSRIMKARADFINKLDRLAAYRHAKLTNGEEKLKLIYCPSIEISQEMIKNADVKEQEEYFYKILERNRIREIQKGVGLYGPHRDDMDIMLNGESTKIFGSQGQQRTSVLSMKLAEIDLMKEESGEYPILLLDDVLSELDERRKDYLMENINGMQTFITCTDKSFFRKNSDQVKYFFVENGNIANDIYLR